MGARDLDILQLAILFGMLLIPMALFAWLGLKLVQDTLVSVARMTGQLVFVGLYLKYLFEWNNPWLNGLWIMMMILLANTTTLKRAGLRMRRFFWVSLASIMGGTLFMVAVFAFIVVRPTPFYDARYLIPMTGMLLGNCLRGNILVLERFFSTVRRQRSEYLSYLLMGATLREAVRPYLREALNAGLAPTVATMMTIGLVSLPGMMTGQMLGGSVPLVAIKYQIVIMLGIFITQTLSAVLNVHLSMGAAFDSYQMLRKDVFR
jgi:UDP-glucose/iron transport system permease protein